MGSTVTVALTALILGFGDPTFTWDAASLRLWVAIFASLFFVNVAVLAMVRRTALRTFGLRSWLDPMPAALIVVALSVLVSRLAHIEPGFLFGLVVGVVFTRELLKAEDGRLAHHATLLLVGLGVGAWLLFSTLPAEGGVAVQFARDLLAATTLEALSTLLVALLPLAFLEGGTLFQWSKAIWAGVYVVAVAAFVVIVLPMSDSWGDVAAPLFGWVTLFAVFALFALGVWAYFRFVPSKLPEHEGVETSTF